MGVCFGSSSRQTTAVWRKSNLASCYIQIEMCLVKRKTAREATEVTKTGKVERIVISVIW